MINKSIEYNYPDSESKFKQIIISSNKFEHTLRENEFTLRRIRKIPNRGFLRLLIPRVVVKLKTNPKEISYKIKPDGLALFFSIMIVGGIILEMTTDRKTFQRDYPAEFVYALFVYYITMIIFEAKKTKRTLMEIMKIS